MSLGKYLALDKVAASFRILKHNGGISGCLYRLFRHDDLKEGELVGIDKYGNKYFENNKYFFGKNRWVQYSDNANFDYDASQVCADWFGWLHYKTDLPPHQDPNRPQYKWMAEYTENLTGTPAQYTPYSTNRAKIEPWIPKSKSA